MVDAHTKLELAKCGSCIQNYPIKIKTFNILKRKNLFSMLKSHFSFQNNTQMSTVILSMGYKSDAISICPPRIADPILTHLGEVWVGLTSFMKRYPVQHNKRCCYLSGSLFALRLSTVLSRSNIDNLIHGSCDTPCLCQTSNPALLMDLPSGSTNRLYIYVGDIPRAPLLYLSINQRFSSC